METPPPVPQPPPEIPPFLVSEHIALLSRVHVGTTIALLALCLVPFVARIYIRIWPVWRFGLDDAFIVAGLICAVLDWALLEREMFLQPGPVPWDEVVCAVMLAYFAIPVWSLAMTLIKTSIVLTLLRLPLRRAWKAALYIIMAVQVVFGLSNVLYNMVKCQPHKAAWDITVYPRRCPSDEVDIVVSHVISALNIATDLLLSVAPMILFWNLRRPLRERVLICSLTSIGLFATFASVMKVVVITEWTGPGDRWATAVAIATWTITEQFVSILAACSPSLKKPIERLLNKMGFPLVAADQTISFVHVPGGGARERAREWMGSAEPRADRQVGAVEPDQGHGNHGVASERDRESLREKTPISPSTSASDACMVKERC